MDKMNTRHSSLSCFAFALFFFIVTGLPAVVLSQTTPLPPAAQAALDKGVIAAKLPDYLLAVKYFEEARKIAPDEPVIYFNLGLAESKLPGRELRAIAWFAAYLAADPKVANAAAVKEQIMVLGVKNRSNISKLIKTLQETAIQLSGYKKTDGLQRVAELWAADGDVQTALKTADLCGDLRDDNASGKPRAYSMVSVVQAKSGDMAGAQKTADLIPMDDADSAKRYLIDRVVAYSTIAEAQSRSGDMVAAKRTFDLALRTASLVPSQNAGMTLRLLAEAQARGGDIPGAQKTIDLIQDKIYKDWAQGNVDSEAKKLAAGPKDQSGEQSAINGSDWVRRLDDVYMYNVHVYEDSFAKGNAPLGNELFVDLPAHLKSLDGWKSPAEQMRYADMLGKPPADEKFFEALHETIEHLITADNAIGRMLRQATLKP